MMVCKEMSYTKFILGETVDDEGEEDDGYEDEEEVEEVELDLEDEKTLEAFAGSGERQNLADLIMAKIGQKKEEVAEVIGDEDQISNLPEELAQHYASVGAALSQYRSGKMPKVYFFFLNIYADGWSICFFFTISKVIHGRKFGKPRKGWETKMVFTETLR